MNLFKAPEMELSARILSVERTDGATIVKVKIENAGGGGFDSVILPIAIGGLTPVSECPEKAREVIVRLGELLFSTFKEPGSLT